LQAAAEAPFRRMLPDLGRSASAIHSCGGSPEIIPPWSPIPGALHARRARNQAVRVHRRGQMLMRHFRGTSPARTAFRSNYGRGEARVPDNVRVKEGLPHPLGATWDGRGTNFALFSAHATAVEVCLFDSPSGRETARIALAEYTDQ